MDKDYIRTTGSLVLPHCVRGKKGFVYVKTMKDRKWGLPGGSLDLFENGKRGINREVLEETGLEIVVIGFLGFWDFKSEERVRNGKEEGGIV